MSKSILSFFKPVADHARLIPQDVVYVGESFATPVTESFPLETSTKQDQNEILREVDDVSLEIAQCKSKGALRILRTYEKKNENKRFAALEVR